MQKFSWYFLCLLIDFFFSWKETSRYSAGGALQAESGHAEGGSTESRHAESGSTKSRHAEGRRAGATTQITGAHNSGHDGCERSGVCQEILAISEIIGAA